MDPGNRAVMLISLVPQSTYHRSNYEISNYIIYLEKYYFLCVKKISFKLWLEKL